MDRKMLRDDQWERMATALRGDADMEHLFIDSAGAQKKQDSRKSVARGAV